MKALNMLRVIGGCATCANEFDLKKNANECSNFGFFALIGLPLRPNRSKAIYISRKTLEDSNETNLTVVSTFGVEL